MVVFKLCAVRDKGQDGLVLVETRLKLGVETVCAWTVRRMGPERVLKRGWIDHRE